MNPHIISRSLILLSSILCFCAAALGQETIVTGVVIDSETKEPIPFANVAFKGLSEGASTDLSGRFEVMTTSAVDSISVSYVGYQPQSKAVQRGKDQRINFELVQRNIGLQTIVIEGSKKDENPAYALLEKIIDHKPYNDREKLETYQYDAYTKVQFDLNNVDDELLNAPFIRKFEFLGDYVDSVHEKTSLPVFLSESVSKFYYRKSPRKKHEYIEASKVSGIENKSISQFTGDMYANLNIYDNDLNIFGKNFTSPIASGAKLTYYFYITDSAVIDGHKAIKLDFRPRRYGDLAFTGHLWVADSTYAVLRVKGDISEEANINFITRFEVTQQYEEVDSNVFMIADESVFADINLLEKEYGFYGRKQSSYKNYVINEPLPAKIDEARFDILVSDSATKRGDEYWKDSRHMDLTRREEGVYEFVDTLEEALKQYTLLDYVEMFMFGYKDLGKFELGPYYTLYSFNPIEGNRVRLGGRTTKEFSERFRLGGYVAYGFRDKVVKYGGDFEYYPKGRPWQQYKVSYRHDLEQLGQSDNAWLNDNILSSLFRRNPANQMNGIESLKMTYSREWYQGFTTMVGMKSHQLWSVTDSLPFDRFYPEQSTFIEQPIFYSELMFGVRYAHRELFIDRNFGRTSIGSTWPIVSGRFSLGVPGMLGGNYQYKKVQLHLYDRIYMSPLGYGQLDLFAGKVWGDVPFPLLFIHSGNETFFYDPQAYNLMNFIEFASDEYVAMQYEHHFEGILFNRVPLFKRLKWREVAVLKSVYGRNSSFATDPYVRPNDLFALYNGPYAEMGVGVENIFRFFRVDLLRRLTYLNHPNISKWGLRMTYQISF